MNNESTNQAQSLFHEVKETLMQLINVLNSLTYDEFVYPNEILSKSTIGEHTRHIIELFQQLMNGYESGVIDYDHRKRNLLIQEDLDVALESIAQIISSIEKNNKNLILNNLYSNEELIPTNYFRELIYNLEHCIHHQAMIKVALLNLGLENIEENFGVAKSTLEYRNICAQ